MKTASLSCLLVGASLALAVTASAADDTQCFAAAANGQNARNEGHLREARAAFAQCAQASCDEKVVHRCVAWLAAVDDAMPTIVLAAQDARGRDLIDARAFLDGNLIESTRAGSAITVDPGTHVARFVRADDESVEQTVIVREREKGRLIRVTFPEGPRAALQARGTDTARIARPIPVPAYVLGGVSVLAAGAATYFAATGLSDRASFGCDRQCTHDEA